MLLFIIIVYSWFCFCSVVFRFFISPLSVALLTSGPSVALGSAFTFSLPSLRLKTIYRIAMSNGIGVPNN